MMRTLLRLVMVFALIAGIAGGAVVHAVEIGAAGEVTEATAWLHAEGDHDQVPADADHNYPHHHNHCQGHDVATPLKLSGVTAPCRLSLRLRPAAMRAMVAAPPAPMLRPPIA